MRRGVIIRGIALGAGALLLVAILAAGWVLFYSVAIALGHDGAFYQAYGRRVAPIAAIVIGAPALAWAGWRIAGEEPRWLAWLIPALAFVALDLILSLIQPASVAWPLSIIAWLLGFGAAAAGGWWQTRRRVRMLTPPL